jgi:hypothetical protein
MAEDDRRLVRPTLYRCDTVFDRNGARESRLATDGFSTTSISGEADFCLRPLGIVTSAATGRALCHACDRPRVLGGDSRSHGVNELVGAQVADVVAAGSLDFLVRGHCSSSRQIAHLS